jgi:phosphate transport system substrate-binding protein
MMGGWFFMFKLRLFLIIILFIFLIVGFSSAKEKINIQGSTTVLPIIQIMAEEFMNDYPEYEVTISGGGSGVGIAALIDQIADIAMSSREIKENELQKAREKGLDVQEYTIAYDAIAVIVHAKNDPIDRLDSKTIKKIYTGFVHNWKDLGGYDRPLVAISRDTNSGTFEIFNDHILEDEEMAPQVLRLTSNRPILDEVSRNLNAIGYVGFGYLTPQVKVLALDDVEPTQENVIRGNYPLSRELFLYTATVPDELSLKFINYVFSGKGQRIVKEEGFIPIQ